MFIKQMPPDIRPLIASFEETDAKKFAISCDRALANYRAKSNASIYNVNSLSTPFIPATGIDGGGAEQLDLAGEVANLRFEVNHLRRGFPRGRFNYQRGGYTRGNGRGSFARGGQGRGGNAGGRSKPADTCFFHWKFGQQAMNCEPPCKFNGVTAMAGNGASRA